MSRRIKMLRQEILVTGRYRFRHLFMRIGLCIEGKKQTQLSHDQNVEGGSTVNYLLSEVNVRKHNNKSTGTAFEPPSLKKKKSFEFTSF